MEEWTEYRGNGTGWDMYLGLEVLEMGKNGRNVG